MSEVQVDAEQVRAAGTSMAEVGHTVGSCTMGEDLLAVAGAVDGADAGRAATQLAEQWQEVISTWTRAAQAQAEALRASADSYDETDRASARAQQHLGGRLAVLP